MLAVCGCATDTIGDGQDFGPGPDAGASPDVQVEPILVPDADVDEPQIAEVPCPTDTAQTFFADEDGDGYGTPNLFAVDCDQPIGFVANDLDCNDGDPNINPDANEVCDGIDNDCSVETAEACPNQCTPIANSDGRVYLFCKQGAAWSNAGTICANQEMQLARVDDATERNWLYTQRLATFGAVSESWIGANDIAVENEWRWADETQFWQGRSNGAVIDGLYVAWRGGEPNNDNNEDCAVLRANDWDDRPCGLGYRFICERQD